MTNNIQTTFKRIETKYLVPTPKAQALLSDLKEYLREDDFPVSTISNIYFDTPDFDLIKDALAKKNQREKIRMRSYLKKPNHDSQAFLEIKQKDAEGVGHKCRLVATQETITSLLTRGYCHETMENQKLVEEIFALRRRYDNLKPRVYIYYDRYSLKQKKGLDDKVRVTFDHNLRYRDKDLSLTKGTHGSPLLDDGYMIMEIKTSAEKPVWLRQILAKHGIQQVKFSKYAAAYHKTQGLPYQPRPLQLLESQGA